MPCNQVGEVNTLIDPQCLLQILSHCLTPITFNFFLGGQYLREISLFLRGIHLVQLYSRRI